MRLILEIALVAALIWFGWEKPFKERLPGAKPADAATVNQSHLPETARPRFGEVLQRHIANFVRTKRMKVERIGDRDLDRALIHGPRILCDTLENYGPLQSRDT